MIKRYRLLVFDWDGTLMDSTRIIVASLQAACRDLGLAEPLDEQANHVIGLGLTDAMTYILPDLAPSEYPRIAERYGIHFRAKDCDSSLFPGAGDALRALKDQGYLLAVATGKSRRGLDLALARTGLAAYFDATRCGEESGHKPGPGMISDLIRILGVERAETLMIGDTIHDLQMAINAGVDGVAVGYGAHSRDKLMALNPLGCANRPEELWEWLSGNG
jgi:phosphoglycolate phosphatase